MFDLKKTTIWFKKNFTLIDVGLLMLIIVAFTATRVINLDKFPIFTDEGIYIHWAKVAWHDAAWRFISLTDGRQPLQTWATIPFLKMFPDNLLLGGRLFAVTSGLLTLTGLFTTAYYLLGKRVAYITAILYIITPYFLFHDRLALADSLVNAGVIWMFLLGILLARKRRFDFALILGLVGGMALLTKSSVKLFFGLTFLSSIFILNEEEKEKLNKLVSFVCLYGLAAVLALVMYNVQRLSPFFHFIAFKNTTFVLSFHELLANPTQLIPSNLKFIPYYISSEMAYVVALLGLVGLVKLIKNKKTIGIYIALWLLGSFTVVLLVARVLYPRYILSLGMMLLLPASYLLSTLEKRWYISTWIIVAISVFYFNYTIMFAPSQIPLPQVDRGQYLEGWPAGWGIKEIIDYAREKSKKKPVTILAEGNFGMSGDVLDATLKSSDKNIVIKAYWPLDLEDILDNLKLLDTGTVLAVFSHRSEFPESWPIKKIKQFDKPNGQSALYLYELVH